MNKTELIAAVAEKAGLTKKDVEKTITATRHPLHVDYNFLVAFYNFIF